MIIIVRNYSYQLSRYCVPSFLCNSFSLYTYFLCNEVTRYVLSGSYTKKKLACTFLLSQYWWWFFKISYTEIITSNSTVRVGKPSISPNSL